MKRPAPAAVSPDPTAHNDSMRRLQIGIAGVMAVLLLVGLAGLIGDRAREQAANEAGVPVAPATTGGSEKSSGAPLEELGVQPVTSADPSAAAAKAAAKEAPMAPPTAKVPDLEPDPALQRARSKTAQ